MGGAHCGPRRRPQRPRDAAQTPEVEAFYKTLKGFFAGRDKLRNAALDFMPNGAAAFDDVGEILRQEIDAAADVDAMLDALYDRAPAAKEALDAFSRRVVTEAGLDPDKEMIREACTDGEEGKPLRAYSAVPLKTRERAAEKAKDEYDGDAARLVDVARGSIVCGDEASLVAVLQRVLEDSSDESCEVVRSKNRFRKPLFNGYRDVLINLRLRLPDGTSMIVELQVHHVQLLKFKAKTHASYEFFRNYFSGNFGVAGRMRVLESIAGGGTASLDGAVESAVSLPERSLQKRKHKRSKLQAFDNLLSKLIAHDLLTVVRECLCDMALAEFGEDSQEYSDTLHNLAELLEAQDNLESAEPLYRRALEIDEKHLGPDHPEIATSLGNLASLLTKQGKLDAAEPFYRSSLEIKEKQLGPDHPSVSISLHNLALLLEKQGKLESAEPLCRRALAIRQMHLGLDHPEVATSLGNLAGMLEAQGKLDAAEPLNRRAIEIREKQLGPDHPDVATSLSNLAELLRVQGKLDAAEPLYRRTLEIREKQLGPEHPDVAKSLGNLASLLQAQGKLAAAEPLYLRALEIYERQLEPDHPEIATSLGNLAAVLQAQGKLEPAEPLYRRALAIRQRQLGLDHPSVAISLDNLARLLKAQGELDAAEPLYRRALAIREKELGPDHSDVGTSLNKLALLLWRLGRINVALPYQEYATCIKKRLGDAKEAKYRADLDQMRCGAKYPYKK